MLKYEIQIEENIISIDFEKENLLDELTLEDYEIIEKEIENKINNFNEYMHDYERVNELVYIKYSYWKSNPLYYLELNMD